MKNHPEKPLSWLEAGFVFLALTILCRHRDVRIDLHTPLPKNLLIHAYGVDPKTFAKWIALFCPDLLTPEQYASRRKLPPYLALAILLRLGFPDGKTPVLSKRQIIDTARGSYRSLRESIRQYPQRFGINAAVFKTLHAFPPEIARQIREQYG